MDIIMKTNHNEIKIDNAKFQKMSFIYNALEEGWTIKKLKDSFVFRKKHEGKKEIFDDAYLLSFMKANADFGNILK